MTWHRYKRQRAELDVRQYLGLLSLFADFALFQRYFNKASTHLGDLGTPRNALPVCCGRTCQTALIYLEVDSSNQAHVRRDVVSSGEGDYVGSENLFLIYYLLPISIVRT